VACGLRCSALFPQYDPLGYLLRMYLLSEAEERTQCSLAWKRKVTPAGRAWLVLGRSGRRTKGTECGSWPTATDSGGSGGGLDPTNPRGIHQGGPPATATKWAELGLWPTVHGNQGTNGPTGTELGNAVNRQWPTPTKRDDKSIHASPETHDRNARPLSEVAGQSDPASPSTIGKPRGSSLYEAYIRLFGLSCARLVRRWWNSRERQRRPRSKWLRLPTLSSGSLWGGWVSELMGFPHQYAAALTKACCDY
jgi:hypothetical protein